MAVSPLIMRHPQMYINIRRLSWDLKNFPIMVKSLLSLTFALFSMSQKPAFTIEDNVFKGPVFQPC